VCGVSLQLAIGELTLEAPQNALLGALQTQEKATFVQQHGTKEDLNTALAPQSGCGHTNELHAAQKPVLRPSGFDLEESTVGTIGFQQPKDIQNPLVLCSSSEQISAAHSNFWHTVNANYQDQQGNHNMFPRSSSMMPPSTGFGLNQQNYPEIHGVGGLPQSSAQPCLIKPQPLVLAHDDAQKMNFNSKKLFGIHLDSSAKPELLKSPPSVLYDGMPQTPEAAECRQPDTTEVEKCSDPIMTLKQLDASQVHGVPEKYLSCVQQIRSCKKVRFLVFIFLIF
jgi:hypothetical protein